MGSTVLLNQRVALRKTLLGLRQVPVYEPTGSKINSFKLEYNAANGKQMEKILLMPSEQMEGESGINRITPSDIGCMLLEACISEDHHFAAFQLFKYQDLDYHSVTSVLFYEGKEAEKISSIVVK